MKFPNQERCCECGHWESRHHAECDVGEGACGCKSFRYERDTQNHSTKDYQDLTDDEKKEMMLDLARKANKSQRDMVHSTMEEWEEEFDACWNDAEREGYFDRRTTKREIRGYIQRLLAKERESAERRGLETALDIVDETKENLNTTISKIALGMAGLKIAGLLEAARKDTTD